MKSFYKYLLLALAAFILYKVFTTDGFSRGSTIAIIVVVVVVVLLIFSFGIIRIG